MDTHCIAKCAYGIAVYGIASQALPRERRQRDEKEEGLEGGGEGERERERACVWIQAEASMQEIIEVHREMKDCGFPNVVADYILEFTNDSGAWWLMVPYGPGTIPWRFQRTKIGVVGYGSSLPGTMNQLCLLESACLKREKMEVFSTRTVPIQSPMPSGLSTCATSANALATRTLCPQCQPLPGSFHAIDCPATVLWNECSSFSILAWVFLWWFGSRSSCSRKFATKFKLMSSHFLESYSTIAWYQWNLSPLTR